MSSQESLDFRRARRLGNVAQRQARWYPYTRTNNLDILPHDQPRLLEAARIWEDDQYPSSIAWYPKNARYLPVLQQASELSSWYMDAARERLEALEALEPEIQAELKARPPKRLPTKVNPYSRKETFKPGALDLLAPVHDDLVLDDPVFAYLRYREISYRRLSNDFAKQTFFGRVVKPRMDSEGQST